MKDPLLSSVIARISFSDLTNEAGFVSSLSSQEWFKGLFGRHDTLKEIQSDDDDALEVHRFSEMRGYPSGAYLDVSARYACLVMNGGMADLPSDTKLISILAPIWRHAQETDTYTRLMRIGLRKVWSKTFVHAEEADHCFKYFDQGLVNENESLIERKYVDVFWSSKYQCAMNSIRSVKTVNEKLSLRFTLDLDAYKNLSHEGDNPRPDNETFIQICNSLSGMLNDVQLRTFVEEYRKGVNSKVEDDE